MNKKVHVDRREPRVEGRAEARGQGLCHVPTPINREQGVRYHGVPKRRGAPAFIRFWRGASLPAAVQTTLARNSGRSLQADNRGANFGFGVSDLGFGWNGFWVWSWGAKRQRVGALRPGDMSPGSKARTCPRTARGASCSQSHQFAPDRSESHLKMCEAGICQT
jgi:hypothetical protein